MLFLLILGIILFKDFFEAVFFALLFDLVYMNSGNLFYINFITTASMLIVYFLVESIKKYLKFYPDSLPR